jgi:Uma2 family endonuclease
LLDFNDLSKKKKRLYESTLLIQEIEIASQNWYQVTMQRKLWNPILKTETAVNENVYREGIAAQLAQLVEQLRTNTQGLKITE